MSWAGCVSRNHSEVLTHSVREKDVGNDASGQKCQILWTILQTSDAGHEDSSVDINQFEELLQGQDILKQRAKVTEG